MKIIIEDGLSLKQERGIGQYSYRLYEFLSQEMDIDVEMPRKNFLENIKNSLLRRLMYCLWLNTFFVIKTLFLPPNSIYIFTATMTPFIKLKKMKYISIIHDIRSKEHPEFSTKIQNLHADFVNWTAIFFSDRLITVSETMRKQIANYYRIESNKIYLLNNMSSINTVEYDENEDILFTLNIQRKNFLFFIGGLDKNKNINIIVKAFEIINKKYKNIKLVIAGNKGNDTIISSNENIIFTGFISNKDIKVLYKNALIYLFPSLYEGFGIPILDAQIMDCPIICSNIPIFREVAGKGALFCEPNIENFADSIQKLLTNENLYLELVHEGKQNVLRYSLDNMKKQLEGILNI